MWQSDSESVSTGVATAGTLGSPCEVLAVTLFVLLCDFSI